MNSHPISKDDLIHDFKHIGIEEGMNIMVHSSLSKIGWVIGGPQTVIYALKEVIGEYGTIVMPAATPNCLHPRYWEDTDIPEEWIPKIEAHLPVFDKYTTPTAMGAIPEAFRNWPKTLRSDHPISSVCANGKLAETITTFHNLEFSEGVNTPYEKIYEFDFRILLLGVGFNRCTMLHFAESKSKNPRITTSRYAKLQAGQRVWLDVRDMANDNSTHFPVIGEQYVKSHGATIGKTGHADSILLSARSLVDFATKYFDEIQAASNWTGGKQAKGK